MPVPLDPPAPANSVQPGVTTTLLYNGSCFRGHQKSKGNCYDVEVVLQVSEAVSEHEIDMSSRHKLNTTTVNSEHAEFNVPRRRLFSPHWFRKYI